MLQLSSVEITDLTKKMMELCTVGMLRELLSVQLKSFRSAVTLLTGQINEEIKWIKGEVNNIKASLQYTQKDVDEMTVKISRVEKSCDVRGKQKRMIFSSHRKILFNMVSGLCATLEQSAGMTFPSI